MPFEECEMSYKTQARTPFVCLRQVMTSWTEGQRGEKSPHCEILVGNSVNHQITDQITSYLNKGHMWGRQLPHSLRDGRSDSV